MKTVVHIGTEKTGTTTIQAFLTMNRKLLEEHDILVPETLGHDSQRLLPAIVNDPDFIDDLFRSRGLLEVSEREAAKDKWRRAFQAEIASSKLSCCVISSEHLQSRLRSEREVNRLAELLHCIFESVTILLYIREPVATAVSLYSTAVKAGAVAMDIPPPEEPYFRRVVNHADTIRVWSSAFGKQNLKVRLFQRDALVDGSLLSDFIYACDLPKLSYQFPKNENESLSVLGLHILREANRIYPFIKEDGTLNPDRAGMASFFEKHFSQGSRYVPPQERINAYRDAFRESNEWVRQHYFPERAELFSPYVRREDEVTSLDAKEAKLIAHAFVELWKSRPK